MCRYGGIMLVRIGVVSRELNISVRRILQYEEEGLLTPSRKTGGGHRLYGEHEIQHIKNIIHLIHDHGLTVSGIKYLLKMSPCWKIFPCNDRDRCTAFRKPDSSCWKLRQENADECVCVGECERCPIYMSRDFEIEHLFEQYPVSD